MPVPEYRYRGAGTGKCKHPGGTMVHISATRTIEIAIQVLAKNFLSKRAFMKHSYFLEAFFMKSYISWKPVKD